MAVWPLSCPQTSQQGRANKSLKVLSAPQVLLGIRRSDKPPDLGLILLNPLPCLPRPLEKNPSVCKEFRKPVMTHLSARPTTRSSEWQIHCSRQGLSDDSPHVLDCLKPKPYTFQHLLVCKGALSPRSFQRGCPSLGGNGRGAL